MIKAITILIYLILLIPLTGHTQNTGSQPTTDYSKMALIAQGEFTMGSFHSLKELDPVSIFQADRHHLGPEDPAHDVFLNSFYIDIFEVTNKDYKEYMKEKAISKAPRFFNNEDFNQPLQPVVGITWNEAQKYCDWKGKRLPTEAEWEKASRGKRSVKFPWGNQTPDKTKLNFNNLVGKTTNVGSYEKGKSDYGVHDLSGNVSEWVKDWHDPEYYLFSPKENPQGPEKGKYKIIRGGNWRNGPEDVRLTYRNATVPKVRNKTVGFRCAVNAPTETKK